MTPASPSHNKSQINSMSDAASNICAIDNAPNNNITKGGECGMHYKMPVSPETPHGPGEADQDDCPTVKRPPGTAKFVYSDPQQPLRTFAPERAGLVGRQLQFGYTGGDVDDASGSEGSKTSNEEIEISENEADKINDEKMNDAMDSASSSATSTSAAEGGN